jgi:hypothetical protein
MASAAAFIGQYVVCACQGGRPGDAAHSARPGAVLCSLCQWRKMFIQFSLPHAVPARGLEKGDYYHRWLPSLHLSLAYPDPHVIIRGDLHSELSRLGYGDIHPTIRR